MESGAPGDGAGGEGRVFAGGRYVLGELLGKGGMAEVFRTRDTALGVDRAIKILTVEGAQRESVRRRLRAEARAMARLDHPNILRIYDVGAEGDRDYIVMDLVDGGTLAARLAEHGPLPPRQVVSYLLQVLSALSAAHDSGIVHRDVKPGNVLVDKRGTALLADFGIALFTEGHTRGTQTGVAMGSLAFMAPEQRLDARSVGPSADIYAVGATLFNLVTGATPIDLFAVDATSTRWRRLPPGLAPIVARATSYEVGDRYQTAQQMAFALLAVIDQVGATPVPVDPRAEPSWGPGAASLPPDPLATRDAITFLMSPGATRARPEATGSTLADVRAPTLDGETPLEEVEPASPPEVVEPQPAETTPTTAVVEPDPTPEPDIAEGPPPAALDAWERQRGARRHEREQAIWMAAVALMAIALLGAGGIAALEWMVGGLGKDRVATPDVVAQVPLPADPVGTWVGSLDHSDLTLVLRGSPEHLEGDVLVQTSGQERRQQVTGHYDPTTRMLTLHDVGGGLVRATLSADTERLDGTWGATDGSAARSLRATRAP